MLGAVLGAGSTEAVRRGSLTVAAHYLREETDEQTRANAGRSLGEILQK